MSIKRGEVVEDDGSNLRVKVRTPEGGFMEGYLAVINGGQLIFVPGHGSWDADPVVTERQEREAAESAEEEEDGTGDQSGDGQQGTEPPAPPPPAPKTPPRQKQQKNTTTTTEKP